MKNLHYSNETPALASNPARQLAASSLVRILAFLVLNVVLALVMKQSSTLSTIHAFLVLALGVYFLFHDLTPDRMIYVTGYIVGAELLWRGTDARVFWEFGKYAVTFLLFVRLFKEQRFFRAPMLPLLFFIILLPSIAIMSSFNRDDISFNLSGPLALTAATMYFTHLELSTTQLKGLLLAILGPIIGLAFLANFTILTTETLVITVGGKATSAGIGPNQVSSMFGLGIVVAFFLALLYARNRGVRWLMIIVVIWLIAQSALTLSRGGLWTGLAAVTAAMFFLVRSRQARTIFVMTVVAGYMVINYVVFPVLDDFTGGLLSERLQDFDLTGREEIMQADWLIFLRHPLFGVGPGQSYELHSLTYRASSAHIEYTRLLAEHGILGLLALLLLLVMGVGSIVRASGTYARSFTVACIVFAFLFMFHSALRLVAPAFMFGLAAATFLILDSDQLDIDV